MNLININVKLEPEFYKKINHEAIKLAEAETIKKVTLEAEKQCKRFAPGPGNQLPGTTYRASGNLRRSHSTQITPDEGQVRNSAKYVGYVIHGTSRMPARNYPRQVSSSLAGNRYMSSTFLTELRRLGVIE